MESPGTNPSSSDPPISDVPGEVDRLLDQAESLANEIATQTGMEPAEREPTPTGQIGGPEPDAAAAVEMAAEDVKQLESVVEGPSPLAADGAPPPEPIVIGEPGEAARAAVESQLPTVEPEAAGEPHKAEKANPLPSDVPEASPTDATKDAAPSVAVESTVTGSADSETRAMGGRDTSPPERKREQSEKVPAAAKSERGRGWAKSVVQWVLVGALGAMTLIWRAFVLLLVQVDRPFAQLSPQTKTNIGIIGALTLVMGLASLIAPKISRHNPYADMEPFPKAADTEGSLAPESKADPGTHPEPAGHAESAGHAEPAGHH